MGDKPADDTFMRTFDLSMSNLDVGTIWFADGTSLNSADQAIGDAGGLSFQYIANVNNQTTPSDTLNDGILRFNDTNIANSTQLFVSTNTNVLSHQNGTATNLTSFFTWLNGRTSTTKTMISLLKRGDSSKKVVFSVVSSVFWG